MEGEYIFPANNLPTAAAEYVGDSMHSGKHHPLLMRPDCDIHSNSNDRPMKKKKKEKKFQT